MRVLPRLAVTLLAAMLFVPMATIGGLSAHAGDEPAATQILAEASKRLAETKSVHFDLEIEGETFIDDNKTIQLLEAEGDLLRPDRVTTKFKAKLLGTATATIELITIGEESWTTNLLTGNWEPAPEEFGYDPSILFDGEEGLGPVMGKVTEANREDDDEIDDRDTYRVKAVVEQSVIEGLTAGTMKGSPVAVELWVDRETNDLLRAKLVEPESEGVENPATWTLDISDHDRDVKIEAPEEG